MHKKVSARGIAVASIAVTLLAGCLSASFVFAQSSGKLIVGQPAKGDAVTQHASGPFDVKLTPQGTDKAEGSTLGRFSLDKQYHGGLEASAKGEMLTAGTDVQGSAGYVAIERVSGTIDGRTGSFVLQHNGTLTRGVPAQNIIVVPDSGSGQLAGITGKLTVIIEGGKHSYEFDYKLPATEH
jgi:hypothetical protein